ncbi:hypothetical protein SKAU_G00084170 [Synaphobranchus kaupii]|uniref:Uncharacterized protein n=1 Tax=Synaphobranchus kaupii TaxID=118154 RepID=A0A9Q1J5H3_SYNKA|nr:hypothetical protein SKAU_G00084170 [Synaphobranchus kaupii]
MKGRVPFAMRPQWPPDKRAAEKQAHLPHWAPVQNPTGPAARTPAGCRQSQSPGQLINPTPIFPGGADLPVAQWERAHPSDPALASRDARAAALSNVAKGDCPAPARAHLALGTDSSMTEMLLESRALIYLRRSTIVGLRAHRVQPHVWFMNREGAVARVLVWTARDE